jgi:hypothetical protein
MILKKFAICKDGSDGVPDCVIDGVCPEDMKGKPISKS